VRLSGHAFPLVAGTRRFGNNLCGARDKLRQTCRFRSSASKRGSPKTVSDEAVEAGFPPVAQPSKRRRV